MSFKLTYGRKVKPKQYETLVIEISQEYDNSIQRDQAFNELRNWILGKIEEEIAGYVMSEEGELKAEGLKPLFYKLRGLDDLPWKTYKREPCKTGERGWILSNLEGARELADVIRKEGKAHIVMNGVRMVCIFSGDKKQFINRVASKEKDEGYGKQKNS